MAETGVDYAQIWQQTLGTLDSVGLSNQERAFVRLCRLVGVLDQTALVRAPNTFTKDFLEQRVREQIHEALASQLGHPVQLAVSVDESLETDLGMISDEPSGQVHDGARSGRASFRAAVQLAPGNGSGPSAATRTAATARRRHNPLRDLAESAPGAQRRRPRRAAPAGLPDVQTRMELGPDPLSGGESGPLRLQQRPEPSSPGDTRLNPKYTFDTFVIGASNRFAHAAAVAVAEAPAKAYNPLFVYGESGLGKTHLLHAIGHYARTMFPNVRVRYVNSEEFTNDFINSIRDDKASAFQNRYRSVDVLLIDDIQFLQGKLQTQEEFFHTFNTLHNANKQIVITSDLPPRELSGFEDRMRTRFESGLLTDVQPPDLETRIAILRKKAIQDRM